MPKAWPIVKLVLVEPRSLHDRLNRPAQQKCPGEAVNSELPAKQQIIENDNAVGSDTQGGGNVKLPHGLEHSDHGEGDAGEKYRGEEDPQ